jgi:hypothetical protein
MAVGILHPPTGQVASVVQARCGPGRHVRFQQPLGIE